MIDSLVSLLSDWFSKDLSTSLLMWVTFVLVFASQLTNYGERSAEANPLGLLERFISSLIRASWFILILGVFYFFLNFTSSAFYKALLVIEKEEEASPEILEARNAWGGKISQSEMKVKFSYTETETKLISGSEDQILYIDSIKIVEVEQNGIIGFDGNINIKMEDPAIDSYTAQAEYIYWVENSADLSLKTDFTFPISAGQYYEGLNVLIDDKPVDIAISSNQIYWEIFMRPKERVKVEIRYLTRGVASFLYVVPVKRAIDNFDFFIAVDTQRVAILLRPNDGSINYKVASSENGMKIKWELDDLISSPYVGVHIKPINNKKFDHTPSIPVLSYASKGLMLYGILILLTLTILKQGISRRDFSLVMAVYCSMYLGIMGFDLLRINLYISLFVFGILVCYVSRYFFSEATKSARVLIFVITIVFSVGYPLAGLIPNGRAHDNFEIGLYFSILLYLFLLSLITRVVTKSTD